MKYLLDSNVCVRFLNGRAPSVRSRLLQELQTEPHNVAVCSVVKAELFYGALKSQFVQRNLDDQNRFFARFISLPFDDTCALVHAQIRRQLLAPPSPRPIGAGDLLIASIALANNLTLVTHNRAEFTRVPNLCVEDWE